LGRKDEAFEFLRLSDEHYMAARWADCISNARKFLELSLQETAVRLASMNKEQLSRQDLDRPVEVRKYLTTKQLLELKERDAIDKIYGLLSHTGAHPYMAEQDQARLLRQMGLVITQFVLLRLQGALKGEAGQASVS
jgi:hypothetical protein